MEHKGHGVIEIDESDIQDFYADTMNIETGFYGITLTFGVSRREQKPRGLVRLRLSPQMAKVLYLLLRQHLKAYERDMARVEIPSKLAEEIGLETREVS